MGEVVRTAGEGVLAQVSHAFVAKCVFRKLACDSSGDDVEHFFIVERVVVPYDRVSRGVVSRVVELHHVEVFVVETCGSEMEDALREHGEFLGLFGVSADLQGEELALNSVELVGYLGSY